MTIADAIAIQSATFDRHIQTIRAAVNDPMQTDIGAHTIQQAKDGANEALSAIFDLKHHQQQAEQLCKEL